MTAGDSLLHRWFRAGDAGDVESFDAYLHADVVVHAPMGLSSMGIDAERDVWRKALAGIPDLRHQIRDLVITGSMVAARVLVEGTHLGEFVGLPATGKRFSIDQATFARVRDGKFAEIWEIADTGAFLRQVGAIGGAES